MDERTAQTIVKVYAILTWIGAAGLLLIGLAAIFGGSLLGFIMDAATAGMMEIPDVLSGKIIGALAIVIGVVCLLLAFLYLHIGTALWNKKPWARVAILILAVLEIASFPIGTLIGGFAIWFFGFSTEGKILFGKETSTKTVPAAKKKK